ncbi:glycosyltransferase family 4 protein [Deltaproteobacteria bacterium]|nr:glycosyltransferase family 4 protein [Deltaproteobacteria bacterium]
MDQSGYPKKVLCISNHSFMLGGGEKSFLDLLSHLPELWDVLAVVPGQGELAVCLRQNGIKVEAIGLPAIRPWYLPNILSSLKRYFSLFRKYHPAVIYANGSRAAVYGGIIGRALKIPVIWHCRIAEPDIYLDPLLCRLSNKIIVNSKATAKRFRTRFRHKVRKIYNGIDIGWLQDNAVKKPDLIQPDWKVILVIARISRWKRHDIALSVFEKIAMSDPKVHLICVGAKDQLEPKWYKYLMKRTKQYQFSDRIHWIGQVADVRPWYRSVDIFLFPSENEAFGRVLVEAMACGVPVIATRSGGVPEIVRHGKDGFLVTPGDVDEMADAVSEILKNEALGTRLARSAMERAGCFDLSTHVEKMREVFEETLKT